MNMDKFNRLVSLIEKNMNQAARVELKQDRNSQERKDSTNITDKSFVDGISFIKKQIFLSGEDTAAAISNMKYNISARATDNKKPTESSAPGQLIRFSEVVFKETANGTKVDDAGWVVHEICHDLGTRPFRGNYTALTNLPCMKETLAIYKVKDLRELRSKLQKLFGDVDGKNGNGYPTTDIELFTFAMQFKFLKEVRGMTDKQILGQMHRDPGYKRSWVEFMPKFLFMMNPLVADKDELEKLVVDSAGEKFADSIPYFEEEEE